MHFVVSAVSGLGLLLDNPDRRATIALYMLTRAFYELTTLTAKRQNIESPNHILVAMCVSFFLLMASAN